MPNGPWLSPRRLSAIAGSKSHQSRDNGHPSPHYWRISTCAGLCWGGRSSALERRLGTRLVTYADDLVILCRKGSAEAALHHLRKIMGKLKLTVNEDKTRICRVPEGEFDFLGFTFGRMYSKSGLPDWGAGRLARRADVGWRGREVIRWAPHSDREPLSCMRATPQKPSKS